MLTTACGPMIEMMVDVAGTAAVTMGVEERISETDHHRGEEVVMNLMIDMIGAAVITMALEEIFEIALLLRIGDQMIVVWTETDETKILMANWRSKKTDEAKRNLEALRRVAGRGKVSV